jgi:hypothetical protein
VPGLTIKGAKHNVVYVATSTNWIYAYDADDPNAMMPLWSKQVAPPGDVKVQSGVAMTGYTWCGDMYPFVGITSTPVIDVQQSRIYVVSQEGKLGMPYFNKLHVLDLLTGEPVQGSPVTIDASVPGTGSDAVGGMIKFNQWKHMNRAGLLAMNGVVYIGFASHCDDDPYHGWIFGYDAKTLAQKYVYNLSANPYDKYPRAGIWQSGMGLAANQNGIYFDTGNGDTSADGKNLGTSVVRMTPDLKVADWFTPSNWSQLNGADADLTGGVVLVPGSNFLISGGKESVIYVIDQMNMTKLNTTDMISQRVSVGGGGEIHNFAFWNNRAYVWPDGNSLHVYSYANGKLTEVGGATMTPRPPHPGGIMTLSEDGTKDVTAIVWAALIDQTTQKTDAWHFIAAGRLVAVDAMAPTKILFDTNKNKMRDGPGNLAKFSPPTVANGKVYVTAFADLNMSSPAYLRVYGLLKK